MFELQLKEKYYVDNTSSYWNAFRLWSYYVRNEQISLTAYQKTQPRLGFLLSGTYVALTIRTERSVT